MQQLVFKRPKLTIIEGVCPACGGKSTGAYIDGEEQYVYTCNECCSTHIIPRDYQPKEVTQ